MQNSRTADTTNTSSTMALHKFDCILPNNLHKVLVTMCPELYMLVRPSQVKRFSMHVLRGTVNSPQRCS